MLAQHGGGAQNAFSFEGGGGKPGRNWRHGVGCKRLGSRSFRGLGVLVPGKPCFAREFQAAKAPYREMVRRTRAVVRSPRWLTGGGHPGGPGTAPNPVRL